MLYFVFYLFGLFFFSFQSPWKYCLLWKICHVLYVFVSFFKILYRSLLAIKNARHVCAYRQPWERVVGDVPRQNLQEVPAIPGWTTLLYSTHCIQHYTYIQQCFWQLFYVAVSRDFLLHFLPHESNPHGPLINRLKWFCWKICVFAEIFTK